MSFSSLLEDECRIERRTPGEFDEDTLEHGEGVYQVIYDGPCRITSRWTIGGASFRTTQQEEPMVSRAPWVFLPDTAQGLQPFDVVVITVARDPDLEGLEGSIKDVSSEGPVKWVVIEDLREGVEPIA